MARWRPFYCEARHSAPGAQENPSLAPLVSPARPTHKLNWHEVKEVGNPDRGSRICSAGAPKKRKGSRRALDGDSDGISLAGALRGTSAHRHKGIGGVGRTGETRRGQRGSFAK